MATAPTPLTTNNSNGTYTFNPTGNYNGAVNLTYNVTDGNSAGIPATNRFNIAAVNDVPVLTGTAATFSNGTEDTDYTINTSDLLQGFTDGDGDTLSVAEFTATNGTFTDNGNATYTFNPTANYNGEVAFSYNVIDGNGGITSATNRFNLAAVNDVPVLTGTKATLGNGTEDTAYTINTSDLLQGFTDVEGDTLSVADLSATNGTLTDNGNATYTFNPTANYNGAVSLSYNVTDGKSAGIPATNRFNLAPLDDAPVLTGTKATLGNGTEDTAYTINTSDLLQGFTDGDGDVLSVADFTATNGTFTDNGNATYTFNPIANYNGAVNLSYNVIDGNGGITSATNRFNLAAVNDAPTVANSISSQKATAGTAFNFQLPANTFRDTESDPLTYTATLADGAALPTWLTFNNGTFSGTPINSNAGTLSLKVTATDPGNLSSETSFNLAVASVLNGTPNNDNIIGDNNDNIIKGGAGNDVITGSGGADDIDGGTGNNAADYTTSPSGVRVNLSTTDPKSGGDAEGDILKNIQTIKGSNFNDHLTGDIKANILSGNGGDDTLNGLDGNDLLEGSSGADVLDGGNGADTATYNSSTNGVNVNLSTNPNSGGDAAGDILINIENVQGSNHNDTLRGNSNTNYLYGLAGDDLINGGTGNDYLYGGVDKDFLNGGTGVDYLYGEVGDDNLTGDDGNDYLYGGSGADMLNGGNGVDTAMYTTSITGVNVNLATNQDSGGDALGDTFSSIENIQGSNLDDAITGNNSTNYLYGLVGNDIINGNGGADYLYGGEGRDFLTGASLTNLGVGEIDLLTGNAGADTFVLGTANGVLYNDANNTNAGLKDYARILDFIVAEDVVQLHNGLSSYYLGAAPTGTFSGSGTGIFLDTDSSGSLSTSDELIGVLQGKSLTAGQITGSTPGFSMV